MYETGGWSGYLLGRFIVIADFDLLKEAFRKKTLSNRPVSKAWDGYRKTAVKGEIFCWMKYYYLAIFDQDFKF